MLDLLLNSSRELRTYVALLNIHPFWRRPPLTACLKNLEDTDWIRYFESSKQLFVSLPIFVVCTIAGMFTKVPVFRVAPVWRFSQAPVPNFGYFHLTRTGSLRPNLQILIFIPWKPQYRSLLVST